MKQYSFDDVVILHDKDRIPLSVMERQKRQGPYRYYGAQGVIDHVDDFLFDGEYVLIAEDGENLKSQKQDVAQLVNGKFWVNNHAHIATTTSLCRLRYFYYLINSKDLSEYVTGSAQPKLSQASMRKMSFVLPNINTQDKILGILGGIDDKIKENERINKNLEAQAQAYFIDQFVVNADPTWSQGTLSDLGTVVSGGTPSKKHPEYYCEHGIPWITPKDLSVDKSKFISHGENDISDLGFSNSSATKMPEGTILFSSRAPIGYIAIASNTVTTNQGFKSVIPNINVGTAFVYYFLKQALPTIEGMASGSTFKEISGSGMKSVHAVIPDNETLHKFSEFCKPLFKQQAVMEAENRRLSGIRDALLPKLMSGEIDVSDINL